MSSKFCNESIKRKDPLQKKMRNLLSLFLFFLFIKFVWQFRLFPLKYNWCTGTVIHLPCTNFRLQLSCVYCPNGFDTREPLHFSLVLFAIFVKKNFVRSFERNEFHIDWLEIYITSRNETICTLWVVRANYGQTISCELFKIDATTHQTQKW